MQNSYPGDLKGGKKRLWLKTHREDVLRHYLSFGVSRTLAAYNMESTTLERFLNDNGISSKPISETEKLDIRQKIVEHKVRGLTEDVQSMHEALVTFRDQVAEDITNRLLRPMVKLIIMPAPTVKLSIDKPELMLSDLALPGDVNEAKH